MKKQNVTCWTFRRS